MLLYDPIEIIAVSYHRPNDFSMSIDSILNTSIPYRLTIIDNSMGAIDDHINQYRQHSHVRIIQNDHNIGKGASFKTWYHDIVKENTAPYVVSIDADILVPHDWLANLLRAIHKIDMRFGVMAPLIMQNHNDDYRCQLSRKTLTMHGGAIGYNNMLTIADGVYYNKYVAGPVFVINRKFFEKIGGYPADRIYGHDDGYICKKACGLGLFVGFTTDVECIHLNNDSNDAYKQWKLENINKANSQYGYWDR